MDLTSHRPTRPSLWYWERASFDDQMLERLVDANIASGQVAPPVWKWKLPKTYNGFTGEERVRGWQKVKVAIALGLIPKPVVCSICLRSPAGQMHSEDYNRPLLAKPITDDAQTQETDDGRYGKQDRKDRMGRAGARGDVPGTSPRRGVTIAAADRCRLKL